jgi:hypothetical protein
VRCGQEKEEKVIGEGGARGGQTGKFEERGFRLGQGARSGKNDRRGGLVAGGTRTNAELVTKRVSAPKTKK